MTTTARSLLTTAVRADPRRPSNRLPLGLTPLHLGVIAMGIGLFAVVMSILVSPTAGLLVIGAVIGLGVAGVAVINPTVALVMLVANEFANVGGVLETKIPGVYIGFLTLAIVSALVALTRAENRVRIRRNWWVPAALLMVYLVSIVPGTILSTVPVASASTLDDWLKNILMLVVVLVLLQLSNRPWTIAAAIVLPMAPICVMMALNEYVIGNAFTFGGFSTIASDAGASIAAARHSGPVPDSNFWGRFLLIGLPLALALTHRAWKARGRLPMLWWASMALLLLLGIYLTQSRGTLVAGAVAVVVWIVAVGPQVRKMAMWLIPLVLAGLLLPGIGDRLLTLTETFSGPQYTSDQSLVERENVQTVAIKIFEDNPIFGTGPSTFATEISKYAPLTNAGSTGNITATHNLYTEIGSETGVVGLFGWLVFVIGCILLGVRAVLRLAGAREDGLHGRPTRALAAASVAGLIGWSVASAFLHLSYARSPLIACAMAGLLFSATLADTSLDHPAAVDATRRAQKGLRFGVVASIATTIAAGLVAGTLLTALSRTTYVATADLTLLPTPATEPGYALDIRRRDEVLPTYAAVIQNGAAQPETTVSADPPRGVMTVRAVGASAEEAAARRDGMVRDSQGAIERAGMAAAYRTTIVTSTQPSSTLEITTTIIRIVLIATIVEVLVVITLCARIRREERRQGVWLL